MQTARISGTSSLGTKIEGNMKFAALYSAVVTVSYFLHKSGKVVRCRALYDECHLQML
jgi:hypothetical protein